MGMTTIKLQKNTKERLDKLKSHPRESYEEVVQRILEILNVCRINPEKSREKLIQIQKINKSFQLSKEKPTA